MPNPNYVASNPGGIPKSQISLRSTPTTTGGADNLTLLSFISWCGQTGTNYSGAPFSPLPSLPVAQPTLAPATNNITRKYSFSLKMIFLGASIGRRLLCTFIALAESFCKYCKVVNVCQFASSAAESILHQPQLIVIRIIASRL